MKHRCVKCRKPYEDNEPDDYYCPDCILSKKELAAKLDAKPRAKEQSLSPLQQYDSLPKVKGFVPAKYFQ